MEPIRKTAMLLLILIFSTINAYADNTGNENLYPYVGIVTGNRVNVRSGPSINYEVLGKADKEDRVVVRDAKKEWLCIEPPDNIILWVHGSYVQEGRITAYSVNVRSAPNTNSFIVGQLEKDNPVKIVSIDDEWVSILPPENTYAWISSEFVDYEMSLEEYDKNKSMEIEKNREKTGTH